MHIAKRMSRLGTETAFEVLAKARALEAQGKKIIHLEIGEPDFDTPGHIKDAAADAMFKGYTHYGPSAGLPELREAVAQYYQKRRGITVDPATVVITPGAKPIMFFLMQAVVDEGDEVIYPNPGFPIYESVINFLGAKPVPIKHREELDFRIDVDELASLITPKTRLLIINTPHNPTGAVIPPADLRRIAELAVKHDLIVLSDEIYSRIMYDGAEHVSLASFPGMQERTVILDGFSKTYAMTGWRLGFGIFPNTEIAAHVARLQTNCTSCTSSFTQIAGVQALLGPQHEADAFTEEFRRRRDVIVAGLRTVPGVTCVEPRGAFYVFPNITGTGKDSRFLADYLLNEGGVACLSGTSFGAFGNGYLRFSFANSVENIERAIAQMREAVERLMVHA